MKPLQILLHGYGKLGKRIDFLARKDPRFHPPMIARKGCPFCLKAIDCILDVSLPGAIEKMLPQIQEHNTPLIIGTTGQNEKALAAIKSASNTIPLMLCENFSAGIYYMKKALQAMQAMHPKRITMTEEHHEKKKDKPSGTAKLLQKNLTKPSSITSIRKGNEIGRHKVHFHFANETLVLEHKALDRDLFASGALKACLYLRKKPAGLYSHYLDV